MILQTDIKGLKINYEVMGEGKTVILLHGWLTSLETMKPLQLHLSKKFKVYAVDVVGFGKSELPSKPMNTDDFGDFLNEFIEKLNIKNPILIGHSNGGRMIINFAGRNLKPINKIVLIDSAGIKPKRDAKYYVKIYKFKFCKNVFRILPKTKNINKIKEKVLSKFGSSDYKNSPEVLKKTMSIIVNEDLKCIMPNIKVPTLLIWGEDDTATPISDAKIMEKLIPDAGLVSFKNSRTLFLLR